MPTDRRSIVRLRSRGGYRRPKDMAQVRLGARVTPTLILKQGKFMSLLTISTYVLIIFGANNNSSVASQEFKNEQACLQAKAQVEAYRSTLSNLRYSAICVPLNIKDK
jgi:hypothetical protein